jgi:hypothetical protein
MERKELIIAGAVLGLSIIASSIVGGYSFFKVRSLDNVITVTGSARTAVVSDQVKWVTSVNRTVSASQLKTGYAQVDADLKLAKNFFAAQGITESQLIISPVYADQNYDYNAAQTGREREYNVRQIIEIQSADVAKITESTKNVQSLINAGVMFRTESLEYYYSGLAELRVSLLSDAIKDAQSRASNIAASGGQKVGKLKAASSGVVQVLPANSVEISDYGAYDTSKINKDVMVTVKASFAVN